MSREVIIQRIEKSDLIDAKKELMIEIIQNKKEDDFDKKVDRLYRQFSKSSTFKKHAEKMAIWQQRYRYFSVFQIKIVLLPLNN